MIAAILLIATGITFANSTADTTRDRAAMLASGPTIVAIDSNSDLPSKEYGLLRGSFEGEDEEEDGEELKPLGVGLAPFFLTPIGHTRLAASALGRITREVPALYGACFLRC